MIARMSARLKRTILVDLVACVLAGGALLTDHAAFAQQPSFLREPGLLRTLPQ